MDFAKDPLTRTIYGDLKRGIEITLGQCYFASAAIILFSSIDILANLDRPADKVEGDESDFVAWVERYLLPAFPAKIPAVEVYSARCAILHQLGVESRRTRSGKVRRVGFTAEGGPPMFYNPKVDPTLLLINLNGLVKAFFAAMDKFLMDAYADPKRKPLVEERLQRMLITTSYEPPADARKE